jgi:hypothetical protein
MTDLERLVAQRICQTASHAGPTCPLSERMAQTAVVVFKEWLLTRPHDSVTAALLDLDND